MSGLEILEHNGPAYNPTMHYGTWRVAIANYGPFFDRQTYPRIERHLLTDEVFVLLAGKASLVIGTERDEVEMEMGKIYNVKVGTWHNVLLDADSKVLIVENHNTGPENTEYCAVER